MATLYTRLRGDSQDVTEREGKIRSVPVDAHRQIKNRVQQKLIEEIDTSLFLKGKILSDAEKSGIKEKISQFIREEEGVTSLEREEIIEDLFAEIVGYGPIQSLLEDEDITEIMVNAPDQVYIERAGTLERSVVRFSDEDQILRLIEKIVVPLGRRIDESSPMVDARLPDGSRVNAIIPPLALKSPSITIRKFAKDPYSIDDLISFGTLNQKMALLLEACVVARLNIIVSGGTGSGKTTTLNVASSFIPPNERIVTIEDAAELQLRQEHVVPLETRPSNLEGRGEITVRQLVKNALRMRPDRIVVGEVRAGEALDMLQAMNTGHDGSLTTIHSNGPRDVLSRLEAMVLMAGMDLPVRAIREQVSSAIDLIIHQSRMRDGTRKITHITEVEGMEGEIITLQDLFRFHHRGVGPDGRVSGEHKATGMRPKFMDRVEAAGVRLPPGIFEEE